MGCLKVNDRLAVGFRKTMAGGTGCVSGSGNKTEDRFSLTGHKTKKNITNDGEKFIQLTEAAHIVNTRSLIAYKHSSSVATFPVRGRRGAGAYPSLTINSSSYKRTIKLFKSEESNECHIL